jgi:hypothetical protein
MAQLTAQVLPVSDIGLSGNALLPRGVALSTGTITTSGSSQVVSATAPTGTTNDHRRMVWRIANIGSEAVLVLFYTGAHPNPADAAAARTAGAILMAPNSVEVFAVDQGLPNLCCINA